MSKTPPWEETRAVLLKADAPVELRFVGPDLAELRRLGDEARRIVARVPDVIMARTSMEGGAPKLAFALDEERARLAGLDLVSVARQLDAALEGVTGGSLVEGSEELPVRVRVGAADRADAGFVETFDVVAPGGGRRTRGKAPGARRRR